MEHVKKVAECTTPTTEELRSVNAKLEKSYMAQEKDDPLKKTLSKVPAARKPTFNPGPSPNGRSNKPPLKPCLPHVTSAGSGPDGGIVPGPGPGPNPPPANESPRNMKGAKKSIKDRLRGSVQDSRDEKYFE